MCVCLRARACVHAWMCGQLHNLYYYKVHLCTYLQAIKIHSSALWTELMELKDAIKQASQETAIDNNGLSLDILIFIKLHLAIGSQHKLQVMALLDKCKSQQVELKELQKK